MFKFDKSIPIERFSGQTIWWICFSSNGFRICCENDEIIVNYFSNFCEINSKSRDNFILELARLSGYNINSVIFINENEIHISIEDYGIIRLLDREGDFENYQFRIDGIEFVV